MQENKQEKSQIKQKILLYLSKKGISDYEFYKHSGVTRGILTQNNGIREDNLARFLDYAPDVNLEWLLRGRGNMLRDNVADDIPIEQQNEGSNPDEGNVYNQQLLDKMLDQAEEIGRLKARIDELERRGGENAGSVPSSGSANVG